MNNGDYIILEILHESGGLALAFSDEQIATLKAQRDARNKV